MENENTAPITKNSERPIRSPQPSAGRKKSSDEHDHTEDQQRVPLPLQVRAGAFLHRLGDVLHLRGALAGGQHLLEQHVTNGEGSESDHGDHDDHAAITAGQRRAAFRC